MNVQYLDRKIEARLDGWGRIIRESRTIQWSKFVLVLSFLMVQVWNAALERTGKSYVSVAIWTIFLIIVTYQLPKIEKRSNT